MQKLLEDISGFLWGPVMLVLLIGSALVLSVKLRFIQFTKIGSIYKETLGSLAPSKKRGSEKGISPFAAVSTALAGTMGVGNIAGVATAITAGGAGAIFWMWVSASVCMAVKYCEVVLAQLYREKKDGSYIGGPMLYISRGLNNKPLAAIFALCCILSSFGIGNLTQSNTIAESVKHTVNISNILTGVLISIVVLLITVGGINRISSFTSKLIPVMSVAYIIFSLIVIFYNRGNIINSFYLIFTDAFNFKSAGAGAAGFAISRGIHYGVSRGIFSNEAGLGSAPIAHAAASADSPVSQGMWGIFEVFFDTIVVCTLTALVILCTNSHLIHGLDGINLTSEAFGSVLGKGANIFLTVSIIFFALASILGWSYYGSCCIKYLCSSNSLVYAYRIIFAIVIIAGALVKLDLVWTISDILNACMAIPNMLAVAILSPSVMRETHAFFVANMASRHKKGKRIH